MHKNILLIFLLFTISQAQSSKLGFRIEPTIFFIEEENVPSSVSFSPYSVYFTMLSNPIDNLSFEFRAGYLLGGEEYNGLEFGAFVKWRLFSSNLFLNGGLLNHYNESGGQNSAFGYDKTIFYKGLGAGYQLNSKIGFDIIYYWSSDSVYGYSYYIESHGNGPFYKISMKGIIKLGFSMAWNVL